MPLKRTIRVGFLLAVISGLLFAVGCNNKPPADVPHAKVTAPQTPPVSTSPTTPAKSLETKPAPLPTPSTPPASPKSEASQKTSPPTPVSPPSTEQKPAAAMATPAGTPPTGGPKKFTIVPNDNSNIDFTGYKIDGSKDGNFVNFKGTAELPDGATIEKAKVEITVPIASLSTVTKALTEVLKGENFFETAKFPEAKFVSTSIAKTDKGYDVTGDFTLHGQTKSLTFPATIELKDNKLHAKSQFTLNRRDWGLSWNGFGDNMMKDDVLIKFDILADQAK